MSLASDDHAVARSVVAASVEANRSRMATTPTFATSVTASWRRPIVDVDPYATDDFFA
jgi:hypothetical protein